MIITDLKLVFIILSKNCLRFMCIDFSKMNKVQFDLCNNSFMRCRQNRIFTIKEQFLGRVRAFLQVNCYVKISLKMNFVQFHIFNSTFCYGAAVIALLPIYKSGRGRPLRWELPEPSTAGRQSNRQWRRLSARRVGAARWIYR